MNEYSRGPVLEYGIEEKSTEVRKPVCDEPCQDFLRLQSRGLDQMAFLSVVVGILTFLGICEVRLFYISEIQKCNSLFTSLGILPVKSKHPFLSPLKMKYLVTTDSLSLHFDFQIWSCSFFQCFLNYIVNLLKYSKLKLSFYVLG